MELPATTRRVTIHTSYETNKRIFEEMEQRLWYYLDHPEQIEERLHDLDREWDIERILEANASALALAGIMLGVGVSRKFLLVPTVVASFLLQHALQGWCPPVPVFRHFGVRTQTEIELERYALKALRGDFGELAKPAPELREQHKEYPRKVLQALIH